MNQGIHKRKESTAFGFTAIILSTKVRAVLPNSLDGTVNTTITPLLHKSWLKPRNIQIRFIQDTNVTFYSNHLKKAHFEALFLMGQHENFLPYSFDKAFTVNTAGWYPQ